jgi:DNA-binding NtrC family response regulator/pSer/pThr/pTyr-binding forkhead associated (FHA) protein
MPKLIVKQGPATGQEIPLTQTQTTLGRIEDCDVVIADQNISRRHAMLVQLGQSTAIMDLGSSNGTFVNLTPISRCFLADGDEIRLGDSVLVFSEALLSEESQASADGRSGSTGFMAKSSSGTGSDQAPVPPIGPREMTTAMPSLTDDRSTEALKDIYLKLKSLYNTLEEMVQAKDRKAVFDTMARAAVVSTGARRVLLLEPDGKGLWRRTHAHTSTRITERQASVDPDPTVLQQASAQRRLVQGAGCQALAFPAGPPGGDGSVFYADIPEEGQRFTKDEIDWFRAATTHACGRVEQIEQVRSLRSENQHLRRTLDEDLSVVVRDTRMRDIFAVTQRVAATDSTVLVTGESGTGKELIARSIHRFSPRGSKPIVAVNCAALPETLLESELFGHEKGAFTGAVERRPGKFEQADGGTLFLDEIGDISLAAQSKLLRALQEGEITRVGGNRTIRVDVRVIAATNKDLHEEVRGGRFREDLLFRLKVIEITIPPLRERPEDILALSEHFLRTLRQRIPTPVKSFAPETIETLRAYPYPGNVRELRNIIERGIVFANGEQLVRENLPSDVLRATALLQPSTGGHGSMAEPTVSGYLDPNGVPLPLEQVERLHIEHTMRFARGNKVKSASLLGISRTTLYEKIRQYQLGGATDGDGQSLEDGETAN